MDPTASTTKIPGTNGTGIGQRCPRFVAHCRNGSKFVRLARGWTFPGAGETRHLAVHGRSTVTDRYIRLQASNERLVRQGLARVGTPGPAFDHDDSIAGSLSNRAVNVQVPPTRRLRSMGERIVATNRIDGGRRRNDSNDVDRGNQS